MVTYYLGDPAEKKKKILEKKNKDSVYQSNDEVLAVYGKGRKYCFVCGSSPFGDFGVWEYLSYEKSLELRRPLRLDETKSLLARVGLDINVKKRISRFDSLTQKAIALSCKIQPSTEKVFLNLDGTPFSHKLAKKLKKLLAALSCYEIVVSVSDKRFVPSGANVQWFFGSDTRLLKSKLIKKGKSAIRVV